MPDGQLFALEVDDSSANNIVVVIRGEVDLATAPELWACVDAAIVAAPRDLVLDLTEVSFLDAAGLGVIASARQRLPEQFRLTLRNPRPLIRKVLHITQMEVICAIEG